MSDQEWDEHLKNVVERLGNSSHLLNIGEQELLQLLYNGISIYAITNDESMVSLLMPAYIQAMEVTSTHSRQGLYNAIRENVENHTASLNAFMPFLLIEKEPSIVSTATIDLAMIGKPDENDAIIWPRTIVSYLEQNLPANRGAVFGGLVSLGDSRVNDLLTEIKWLQSDNELKTAANCRTGFPHIAAFDFWLGWLEELASNSLAETGLFAQCTYALYALTKGTYENTFVDASRNFGYMHNDTEMSPSEVHKTYSFHDVGKKYAERLFLLEAQEQPPRITSSVLLAYGIEPKAPLEERYVLQ